jgi:glycosyltransferase involved in cell wall biosynthesis
MAKYKNILIFMNCFWTFKKQGSSGGDEFVVQFINNTNINFGKFYIITSANGKIFLKKKLKKKVIFIITPEILDHFPFYISYFFRTIFALIILPLYKYDLLYVSSDFFPDVLPAYILCLFKKKIKWIQVVHHIYPNWMTRPGNKIFAFFGFYLQKISLQIINKSHLVICVNKNLYMQFKYKYKKVCIANTSVNFKEINSFKKKNIQKKKYDAVFLGRLKPSKGIFDIPAIWHEVVKNNNYAKLVIIGDGNDNDKLKLINFINERQLNKNIILKGFLTRKQIYKVFLSSKIFIFPSREEGFGLSILEALCFELPVIAWDLDVYKAVYGDLVQVVKKFDKIEFAQAVIKNLNSKKKFKKNKSLSLLKKYSSDRQINIIDNELRKIIN